MEMRDELLRFAVEEFTDNLPDEISSEEFAWIIFNILGYDLRANKTVVKTYANKLIHVV